MPKDLKLHRLELPNQPGESCYQARALFLELVLTFKPHIITDLWDTVFPEFKLTVIDVFGEEIFEGIGDLQEYFCIKRKEQFDKQPSWFVELLRRKLEALTPQAPADGSFDELSRHPELANEVSRVIANHIEAFDNHLLVTRIQNKVDPERIRAEFYNFGSLQSQKKHKLLIKLEAVLKAREEAEKTGSSVGFDAEDH